MRIKFSSKNILKVFLGMILIMVFLFWQKTYQEEIGVVVKVVDGDTIELESGETVRYIGMDTPEISFPLTPIECYGPQSTEFNRSLLEGKEVVLKRDLKNRDKFGRLLRYVYVDDIFVNLNLVEEGYARNLQVLPNVSFSRQFENAETKAQNDKKGIWNEEKCNGNK